MNKEKNTFNQLLNTHLDALCALNKYQEECVNVDLNGSTDLYSLSDFKEHKTIDIRKGYLNGRYGSIPFLGNLEDLKWHDYDLNK